MPPVDPTVRLTPWWVNFTVRVSEIVWKNQAMYKLSEKDFKRFVAAVHDIQLATEAESDRRNWEYEQKLDGHLATMTSVGVERCQKCRHVYPCDFVKEVSNV